MMKSNLLADFSYRCDNCGRVGTMEDDDWEFDRENWERLCLDNLQDMKWVIDDDADMLYCPHCAEQHIGGSVPLSTLPGFNSEGTLVSLKTVYPKHYKQDSR